MSESEPPSAAPLLSLLDPLWVPPAVLAESAAPAVLVEPWTSVLLAPPEDVSPSLLGSPPESLPDSLLAASPVSPDDESEDDSEPDGSDDGDDEDCEVLVGEVVSGLLPTGFWSGQPLRNTNIWAQGQ